jgi:hypothetical protein
MLNFNARKFFSVNVFLALTTVLVCSASLADTSMKGWIIKGEGNNLSEGKKYGFFNTDQKEYLRYQDRTGANLGWSKDLNDFMMVQRQTTSTEPIKCEETFGLFIEKEWLMYEKQRYGINLSTRTKLNDPSWYQWKFTNCGASGSPVNLNQPVSLVNTVANSSVVGCKRALGVNLCWAEDVITFRGKNYRKEDVKALIKAGLAPKDLLDRL